MPSDEKWLERQGNFSTPAKAHIWRLSQWQASYPYPCTAMPTGQRTEAAIKRQLGLK
jgi:hypothetical protein